jgi:hypothetical protein
MNPTHPNLNSREYQRQAIDAQIKSLEDSIRALRLQRNALAPISSIPPEITAAIFSFLPHMLSPVSPITPCKKPDPLVWLRVSHVCHQWREIALNQPLLWSHVDFTKITLTGAAEILARTKMVPLYLEARVLGKKWDSAQFDAFQEELQLRVSRINHLLISTNPQRLRKTFDGLVSPAPALESLSLSSEGKRPRIVVPETLFGGMRPRLSSLKLSNCDISWESSLLKGLQCLEIRSPSGDTRPNLSVWLGTLGEMRQLETLTLHSASPMAPPRSFPFEVQRTVALPSLTHLDISGFTIDCAVALAHLELPVLTRLCVEAIIQFPYNIETQNLLPYVARHAHGFQDIQPLQSALVLEKGKYVDIYAWTTPNIDVEAYNPLTMLPTTLPTRVALSLSSKQKAWNIREARMETICTAITALPLHNLVTLIVNDSMSSLYFGRVVRFFDFPKWPLLRRVRLTSNDVSRFLDWLRPDEGGCKYPLLPSLKELVLVDCYLYEDETLRLCDALMKRVEQGVPLEMLDLRTCHPDLAYPAAVGLLSEIVVDVLGPEETFDARAQIESMWDGLTRGPFVGHEKAVYEDSDLNFSDEDEYYESEDDEE